MEKKFNKGWKIFHIYFICFFIGLFSLKAINALSPPIDIHIPTSEEIRERVEFDLSGPIEIETENGDIVSIYES